MIRYACVLALVAVSAHAARTGVSPLVSKVDPPTWWAGHSINPVRLLIRGSELTGAHVESGRRDLRPGAIRVNARGSYALVDLTIDPSARPGPGTLRLITRSGSADVPFEIAPALARAGRFQGFDQDDVVYLLMPDRFANGDPSNDRPARSAGLLDRGKPRFYHGGDLQGLIDRLPYLKDLGITTIWLNPVYDNADRMDPVRRYDGDPFTDYHGYGAVDFYAVDEHLGTMATFRRLVDSAHAAGLKVMQDQVANHTGPFHPWVDDPPTPTWFNGSRERHLANTFDAPLLIDPRASGPLKQAVLEGWFADLLPDLNQRDPDVAQYLIQNSLWWVGMTGIDAIRQDTVPYVPRAFWSQWSAACAREYPSLRIVGEVLEPSPVFVASYQAGHKDADGVDTGLHAVFDYPLFFAARRAFARGGSLKDVAGILSQDAAYPNADRLVTLIGSHDVRRFIGEAGATRERLELAATMLFTMRGIPQWYYGDEIALEGGDDPHNRRDFPGGWPGDPRNAFDAAGRSPVEQKVFAHVRALMHLRRSHEALRRGRLQHLALSDTFYVYARIAKTAAAIVALNASADAISTTVALDEGVPVRDGGRLRDALGNAEEGVVEGRRLQIKLPGRTSAVFVAQ